jgi:hypothetical protein
MGLNIKYMDAETKMLERLTGKTRKPKLLIIGNMRHGKDSLAEIFNEEFGYTFESSSQSAANIFLYDLLKDKYGYSTPEECFEDRVNHRQEWYEAICDYNKDDRARLAKGILQRSDCYVGMRDRDEIEECLKQGIFDLVIWVDASERLPNEDASSFNIDRTCADIVIENNGTYEQFKASAIRLGKILFK